MVLEIFTNPGIPSTVGTIVLSILKSTETFLNIKKSISKIKQLDPKDEKIKEYEDSLKKDRESKKKTIIQNIINVQIQELNLSKDGEKINALKKSIKNLV